ncbi:polysaccharide lyase 6 family protein [soil metagenome]
MNRFFVTCVLVLGLMPLARAEDRLVANNDELGHAIKTAQPGDSIILKDGTWTDAEIKFYGTGEESKPITLRAETPGKVTLSGASKLSIGGSWLIVDGVSFKDGAVTSGSVVQFRDGDDKGANNCRLTNCAIVEYNPPEAPAGNTQWVSLYGQKNRVDHCYFKGKNTSGPIFVVWVEDQPNDHRVDGNYFAGRPGLGRNGGETIRVGTSQVSMNNSRTIVEDNYFENCDGEAEIISNKSCENVYRRNTFVECKGALVMRHGNRCTVQDNWFFGRGKEGTGGIRLIGEDHKIYNNYLDGLVGRGFESAMPIVNGIPNSKPNEYFRVQRAIIAFNTLVNCEQNITFGIGVGFRNRAEPAMNVVVADNLIVPRAATTQPIVQFDDKPIDTTWQSNVFFGGVGGLPEEVMQSGGARAINPQLHETESGLLKPADSNAIRAQSSVDLSFITHDIEGKPRPADARDVGCFQVSSKEAPKYRPLTPADVGPAWMK